MGVEYDVVCDERKDRFEMGKGSWYNLNLSGELSEEAFIAHIVELWGDRGPTPEYPREFGKALFDYCAERGWKVQWLSDSEDRYDDDPAPFYERVGTRYREKIR